MSRISYFQEGGGMPQDPAMQGAPQGGGDPTAEIQAMVQEWAQTQDPQLAMEICGVLAQAMGLGGGQGAPAPQGPPAPEAPAYKRGGVLPGKSAVDKLRAARGL